MAHRKFLKKIFEPLVVVAAAIYFLFDAREAGQRAALVQAAQRGADLGFCFGAASAGDEQLLIRRHNHADFPALVQRLHGPGQRDADDACGHFIGQRPRALQHDLEVARTPLRSPSWISSRMRCR